MTKPDPSILSTEDGVAYKVPGELSGVRSTTVLAVTETIRDRILTGIYPVGHHLREMAVATDLNVSRTPVREALQRLAADGLVNLYPNRGARVSGWSDEEIEETFGLRVLLEGYGARLAAQHMDKETLERLEELAHEMVDVTQRQTAAGDTIAFLNLEFHRLVLEKSGNEHLKSFVSSLAHLLLNTASQCDSAYDVARSFSHHTELIAAFRRADPDWAEAVMRAHLLGGRKELVT